MTRHRYHPPVPRRAPVPLLALGLAAMAALAGCATAGGAGAGPVRAPDGPGLTTLPSGLRVAAFPRPGAPRLLLAASVLCGGEDDPPGRAGLAHLLEHLTYRARGLDGRARREALAAAGARFNARTTPDATELEVEALPGALDAVLAVELDRLAAPLAGVTPADLEAEREVVLRELAERAGFSRGAAARSAIAARVFPGRAEGRPAGGDAEAVRAATLDELRALAAACWRPERAVLALAGPWPAAEGAARLAAAAATRPPLAGDPARPAAPAARPPLPWPPDPDPALATASAPVRGPVLLLGWAVPVEGPDLLRAHGARALLAARLGLRLGEEDLQRQVVSLSVDLVPFDRAGLVVAQIDLAAEADAGPVLRATRDLLVELRATSATFRAVKPLRTALSLEPALALDRLDAAALLRHLRRGGGPDWEASWSALAARALPDVAHGLEGFAFRHLSRERCAAVLLRPDPTAAVPALAGDGGLGGGDHGDDAPWADGEAEPEAGPAPGPPAAAPAAPLVRTLPNGLTVVVAPRPGSGLAEARLVVRAPLARGEPVTLPAFTLAVRGARADERWLHAGRLGARLVQRGSTEALVVAERARGEDLPLLAEDLGRLPGGFELPPPRLRVTAERMAHAVEAAGRDPTERATRALLARLFPAQPAGAPPDATATGALDEAAVRRYLARSLRPEAATLLLVGDAPPEQAFAAAADALGGWRGAPAAPPPPPAASPRPSGNAIQLVERTGARQSLLLVGWRLPAAAGRDEAACLALGRWLERTLDERLRGRGGVSYGAHAVRLERGAEAALVLEAAVDTPATMAALAAVQGAMAGLARQPPGPAVVARLAREVALDAAARLDGVAATADALEADVLAGRPPGAAAGLAASAAALDGARIAAAARALAGLEQVVVLGDTTPVPEP